MRRLEQDAEEAEARIAELQAAAGSGEADLQRGAMAVREMAGLREQLRARAKESADLALHTHELEKQLRDMEYLTHRVKDASEQLATAKLKTAKIPGLLSEIARLRASSRAANKSLAEQDGELDAARAKIVRLEVSAAVSSVRPV